MEKYEFDTFGVMIDMSRNSVMNLPSLKKFMLLLSKMGYNCVMLYTEDTYEIDEPNFGYLRGKYTKEEMKEIDEYAEKIGIEIIPCIQTLAHLNAYIRWNKTPIDCNDILLTDEDKTYSLIEKMFASVSECFKSRRIHIGMDEAHMLGRGNHLDIHGYENAVDIMKRHLEKVSDIAKKYGYTPMLWSDMFFRSWNKGAYNIKSCELPEDVKNAFPNDIIPVYWDYYRNTKQPYDDMFYNHNQLSDKTWFAGGIWGWGGLVPFNELSLENMKPAMQSCREHGIKNVFMTLWGDNGGECSHFAQIPGLFTIIEYAQGNEDVSALNAKFKKLFGLEYDDFMKVDIPNQIGGFKKIVNPSKYMLYSDPFAGFLDYTVSEGAGKEFEAHAKTLDEISKKSKNYGYIFKTESKLCYALAIKYELGVRTRKAYKANDKEALKNLIPDYTESIKRIKDFYNEFFKMWHKDFKANGFEVQQIRLGGLMQRLDGCKKRLQQYIDGKISVIDELEEDIIPSSSKPQGESIYANNYTKFASVNMI